MLNHQGNLVQNLYETAFTNFCIFFTNFHLFAQMLQLESLKKLETQNQKEKVDLSSFLSNP